MAIIPLKANTSNDEKTLFAELLHFAPDDFFDRVLELFNGLMHSPQVPIGWRKPMSTPGGLNIEIFDQKIMCLMAWLHVEFAHRDEETTRCWSTFASYIEGIFLSLGNVVCDRNVSTGKTLRYFDAVISPVAGHRTVCKTDLRDFDVVFRKLLRSVFCPPIHAWTRPVHGMKSCVSIAPRLNFSMQWLFQWCVLQLVTGKCM